MVSFDVKALFTSVPIQPAITIIKKLLEEDQSLQQRTSHVSKQHHLLVGILPEEYLLLLPRATLSTTRRCCNGFLLSAQLLPIYSWRTLNRKQLVQLHTHLTSGRDMWMTPLPSWSHHIERPSWTTSTLLTSISSFTCEEQREDGSLPFLDVLVIPKEDGSLNSTVFRKATHTDLYLQWDSHHTLPSKYSVVGTLLHRANTICSEPQLLRQEEDHLYKALSTCKYPTWALNRINMKIRNPNTNGNNTKQKKPGTDNIQKPHIHFHIKEGSVKV